VKPRGVLGAHGLRRLDSSSCVHSPQLEPETTLMLPNGAHVCMRSGASRRGHSCPPEDGRRSGPAPTGPNESVPQDPTNDPLLERHGATRISAVPGDRLPLDVAESGATRGCTRRWSQDARCSAMCGSLTDSVRTASSSRTAWSSETCPSHPSGQLGSQSTTLMSRTGTSGFGSVSRRRPSPRGRPRLRGSAARSARRATAQTSPPAGRPGGSAAAGRASSPTSGR